MTTPLQMSTIRDRLPQSVWPSVYKSLSYPEYLTASRRSSILKLSPGEIDDLRIAFNDPGILFDSLLDMLADVKNIRRIYQIIGIIKINVNMISTTNETLLSRAIYYLIEHISKKSDKTIIDNYIRFITYLITEFDLTYSIKHIQTIKIDDTTTINTTPLFYLLFMCSYKNIESGYDRIKNRIVKLILKKVSLDKLKLYEKKYYGSINKIKIDDLLLFRRFYKNKSLFLEYSSINKDTILKQLNTKKTAYISKLEKIQEKINLLEQQRNENSIKLTEENFETLFEKIEIMNAKILNLNEIKNNLEKEIENFKIAIEYINKR